MCFGCIAFKEVNRVMRDHSRTPTSCSCKWALDCACGDGKGKHWLLVEDDGGSLIKTVMPGCVCEDVDMDPNAKVWKCTEVCQNCIASKPSKTQTTSV